METTTFNPDLNNYISTLENEFEQIIPERKDDLKLLGDFILEKSNTDKAVQLVFICTHNSRRSHFGQAWALTAAEYYGLEKIVTFSGGTEATAFNTRSVDAFRRAGFEISVLEENNGNPKYALRGGENFVIQPMFSKKYDDAVNPESDFAAIMVCSDADEACPFVPGASARFSITYVDPKAFDGTPREEEKYDERCRQIAREIFYLMKYVKSNS